MLYAFATRERRPCSAREIEAPLEVAAAALDLAGHQMRRADRVECERLACRRRRCARASSSAALAPANTLGVVAAQHPEVRRNRVREGELSARRQLLEDLDRLAARLLGRVVEADARSSPRQPRARFVARGGAGRRAPGRSRSPPRAPRSTRRSGPVSARLRRVALEQRRARSLVGGDVIAERSRVLLRSLAMRADAEARAAAAGAKRSTASPLPAASAWCASALRSSRLRGRRASA